MRLIFSALLYSPWKLSPRENPSICVDDSQGDVRPNILQPVRRMVEAYIRGSLFSFCDNLFF